VPVRYAAVFWARTRRRLTRRPDAETVALHPMYVSDLTHFLEKSGAIAPVKGPARAMAQFHVDLVAHASDTTSTTLPAPRCFKCKKGAVEAVRAHDDAIVWICPTCRTEGRISNWQGSLWDLRDRPSVPG
jgi:hypothetical protein